MPLGDRLSNDRPILDGSRRQQPTAPGAQVPPPVVPPPAAPGVPGARNPARQPRQNRPAGGNPAAPAPSPGAQLRPGQRPPDPARDALPPAFAKLVAGGMPESEARRRWSRSLQNRGKLGGSPGAPGPGPGPGGPAGPGSPGSPPGGGPTGLGLPPPGTPVGSPFMPPMPPPTGGSPLGANDFRDPMMQFLSAVPVMNANMNRQIGDAMAGAGFSGNRYGTSAMNAAGQIGAENALQQNMLMQNLLADYSNRQEDRALDATGMSIGLGGMLDQQAQDRVRLPFELGQWEQGRQDDFSKWAYDDFERSKLGWLPMMLGAAQSQGAGSPGQIVPITQQGGPGAADWAQLLLGLFG